jgi:hypothetical protein
MKASKKALTFALKSGLLVGLTALSFSAYAVGPMYLGNPDRPGTVWQPANCGYHCGREGHFIKFINQPMCNDVTWTGDHFKVHHYVVINPGSEQNYAGVPQ